MGIQWSMQHDGICECRPNALCHRSLCGVSVKSIATAQTLLEQVILLPSSVPCLLARRVYPTGMPRTDNRRAHRLAVEKGWYLHWDAAAGGSVSCAAADPNARPDIMRAIEFLRSGSDSGPRTMATIATAAAAPPRWASGSVGIVGENVGISPGARAFGR